MAVPKYNEMYASFLKALSDGNIHNIKEIRQYIIDQMGLQEADLVEMLPSGKQVLFTNRLGWTREYLNTIIRVFAHMKIRYLINTQYFLSLYGISN